LFSPFYFNNNVGNDKKVVLACSGGILYSKSPF